MHAFPPEGFHSESLLLVLHSTNTSVLQSGYVPILYTHLQRAIPFTHNSLLNKQQTPTLFLELPRHHFPLSQSFLGTRCFAPTPILQHQISCYLPGLYLIFILFLCQFLSHSLVFLTVYSVPCISSVVPRHRYKRRTAFRIATLHSVIFCKNGRQSNEIFPVP